MKKHLLLLLCLICAQTHLCAQNDIVEQNAEEETPKFEYGAMLITELETDFGKRAAWANYLRLDGQWNINKHHSLQVATQHIYSLGDNPVVDELQYFSNIRDENTPLALAKLGYGYTTDLGEDASLSAFLGVRTENEDYFISPLTSFFVNSSDAIFPNVANNCSLPNFMQAAMGVHLEFAYKNFLIKNSLYNGQAGKTTDGSAFRVNPKDDGVLDMGQLQFVKESSAMPVDYTFGWLYHSNDNVGALWLLGEQGVAKAGPCTISLVGQLSWAFGKELEAKDYQGLGMVFDTGEVMPLSKFGMMWHRANFDVGAEQSFEVTALFNLCKHIAIQPSVQYISGVYEKRMAGVLRAIVTL